MNNYTIMRFAQRTSYVIYLFIYLCCPAVPDTAPTDVGGGGGTKSELVITWEVSCLSDFTVSLSQWLVLGFLLNCVELNGAIL